MPSTMLWRTKTCEYDQHIKKSVLMSTSIRYLHCLLAITRVLFHHQAPTGIVNVKFREVNVDLLPGTSSGK